MSRDILNWMRQMIRHVSFMRLPHISLIAAYFSKVHISCVFFSRKLVLLTTILILFVFLLPTSIRFRYLGHLIANRMAPSMCLGPCGTRWGSWFQVILYHISAAYMVFMWSAYFFKRCIKLTCLDDGESVLA